MAPAHARYLPRGRRLRAGPVNSAKGNPAPVPSLPYFRPRFGLPGRKQMERRSRNVERRQQVAGQPPQERRLKSRRKLRKFEGSPTAEALVIDMSDEDVVRYWATELEVNADELRAAVQSVGPTVKAVREQLGR